MESNERAGIVHENPQFYEERVKLAGTCSTNLGIEFPALVDRIENSTEVAYTGWPDRLYVIDKDGRVAFKSAAGPFGFKPDQLANALVQIARPDTARE
jgi:hypothetical protein